jgi:light-harvesting complex I chlorophyll a/b binding protein 1
MAPLTAPVVALLMLAGVQADDMADRSRLQGFLPQTSAGDYDKFITPNLKHMKHTASQHVPEEEKAAQKMLGNDSNTPVSLSAIGIGLVSFVTMLGLTLWRGLQPATIPTNTGGQVMEMKSQDSSKVNSRAGWGQLSSQTSRPLTVAYAAEGGAQQSAAMPFLTRPKNLDGTMAGDVGFDPLGLSEIDDLGIDLYWLREAEIKHGRVAMLATTGVIWVEAFGPLPGWPEADGRSQMDVFWDAMEEHPNAIVAALLFITIIEVITGIGITAGRESGERVPGDFKLNPLEFEITEDLRLKEIKHCRLAMWAVMGQIGAGLATHAPAFSNMDNMF